MKTFTKYAGISAVTLLVAASQTFAQADVKKLGRVKLVSIEAITVVITNKTYYLNVVIGFENKNSESLKLRNGVFRIDLEGQTPGKTNETTTVKAEKVQLHVGGGGIRELEIPGARDDKPGIATADITVAVGPKDDATLNKLIEIWNIVGNPETSMAMILKGKSELGVKMDPSPGYVYLGTVIEIDFKFTPLIQRKVLFN